MYKREGRKKPANARKKQVERKYKREKEVSEGTGSNLHHSAIEDGENSAMQPEGIQP